MEGLAEERWITDLWKNIGEELIARLEIAAVPLCVSPESDHIGINIFQARYKNKKGNIRTKWVSDNTWVRGKLRKKELIAWCQWTFLPVDNMK